MSVSIYSRYYGLSTLEVDGRIDIEMRPPPAESDDSDAILHICVGRETLDQLAKTYYGREDLWWRIADANPRRFPFEWQPGEQLVIPPLRKATQPRTR